MVNSLKGNKRVLAWNLGNDFLSVLAHTYPGPDRFAYRNKYLDWLKALCTAIQKIDPLRPVAIEVEWNEDGPGHLETIRNRVPELNGYFLMGKKDAHEVEYPLPEGAIWGSLPSWQDMEDPDYYVMNGIVDLEGREKEGYTLVKKRWGGTPIEEPAIPDIKILKPAKAVVKEQLLYYHALTKFPAGSWKFYHQEVGGLTFEWYLLRTDQQGHFRYSKKLGVGSSISLKVPSNPQLYYICLKACRGNKVKEVVSTLHIPLHIAISSPHLLPSQ